MRPAITAAIAAGLAALTGCSGGGECPPDSVRDETGNCTQVEGGSGDDGGTGGTGDEGGETGDEGTGGDDTGTEPFSLELGDPIEVVAKVADNGEGHDLVEWMDAEVLDAQYGIVTGQGGWGTIDLETGATVYKSGEARGYRLAVDGERAVIGRRTNNLVMLDLSDPLALSVLAQDRPFDGYHEDVAFDDERVLVGYHEQGGVFLDTELQVTGSIPVDDAFAVGLSGERALVTSGSTLSLWDVSDLSAPVELTSVELEGEGRDLAWTDSHVAVALGGNGIDVFDLSEDTLTARGHLDIAGSAFGVDIDGDYLWIGAWEVVGLAWLGEGGPVMVGHEDPAESAMGVGAGGGVALIADWKSQSVMKVVEGVAGPELVAPKRQYFPVESEDKVPVRLSNGGAFDLEVSLGTPEGGWSWDEETVVLEPGSANTWFLEPPSGGTTAGTSIAVTSNDPDELETRIDLIGATNSVGQEHPPFTLESFTWPDETIETWDFDPASTEKITFLVYFALY